MDLLRCRASAILPAMALLLLAGCDGGEGGEGSEPGGMAAMAGTSTQDVRVPLRPTQEDELPPAIVGEGGDLMGTDLGYVPEDSLTTGYLAVPEGEGPFPALVIVHEWNGLVDRVRQLADDLAAEGYVTLAVDLYRGRTGSTPTENMALVQEVQADQGTLIANLDAAVSYLRNRQDVTGRIGTMGWCFGGGIALSYGLDGAHHEATAIFYGSLIDDPEELARMDHEVYGTFARLDDGPSPESVAAFEAALQAAGIESDLHIYDEVDHGFWLRVDEDPDARTTPALDAWQRLKAYLDRTVRQ
jgi:carboxymethylenebutenolidase